MYYLQKLTQDMDLYWKFHNSLLDSLVEHLSLAHYDMYNLFQDFQDLATLADPHCCYDVVLVAKNLGLMVFAIGLAQVEVATDLDCNKLHPFNANKPAKLISF